MVLPGVDLLAPEVEFFGMISSFPITNIPLRQAGVWSFLGAAAMAGRSDVVAQLLDAGANPNPECDKAALRTPVVVSIA